MVNENLESENDLQEWLAEKFTRCGWHVRREVHPDGSNDRVDLLIEREPYTIGIETKYLNTPAQGARVAQAYKQITEQYWNETYDGEDILLWAVCLYFEPLGDPDTNHLSALVQACERSDLFLQNFLTQFGVGYLSLSSGYASISFRGSENEYSIPAFSTYNDATMDWRETDRYAINQWVAEQRGVEYSPHDTVGLGEFI